MDDLSCQMLLWVDDVQDELRGVAHALFAA
jgi:hypothetical protein